MVVLRHSFDKNRQTIDAEKFGDPGIQYEMYQTVIDVVRRGKKSNLELLAELLCTVTSKNCPELIELIGGEARKIIPILTKKHISYLSFVILASSATLENPSVKKANDILRKLVDHLDGVDKTESGDLLYLTSNGCMTKNAFHTVNFVPQILKSVDEFKTKDIDDILKIANDQNLTGIVEFINIGRKIGFAGYSLSVYGQLIGWLNMGHFSDFNPKKMF